MGGKKVKKILNWDKKSIKVLKFRGKNTKNIMCEKIVQKVGFRIESRFSNILIISTD